MKFFALVGGVCLFLLLLVIAGSAAGVPFLESTEWMASYSVPAAVLFGNLLLIVDVLLPIPSSLLMVANGALLGPVWGSVASLASSTLAGLLAFWIGRKGSRAVARFVGTGEIERADRFFQRWGGAAIVLSRPIPIIAEAVGALAGTTALSWSRFAGALVLGNLPISVLYALAGASVHQVRNGSILFVALVGAASLWLLLSRKEADDAGARG
jgi:uncharacterized membrane protein YdjX (TVP38/TMEM64 family)